MNIFNRFYFFSFGVFLGIVLIFFSLGERKETLSFNYFPNNRIKKHLKQNKVFFSKKAICKMTCLDLDTALLDNYISNSNVDFKKSKIRGYNDKIYWLSFNFSKRGIKEMSYLTFEKKGDSITLVDVFFNVAIPFKEVLGHPGLLKCQDCLLKCIN